MSEHSPLVSILTPSFNQARWLGVNLQSVANQTYPNVEHIVMDGGSTDGSVELLERSEGIVWKSEPDRGQSHALNKAFQQSRGEIIGWVNSDDAFVEARAVERVVKYFADHPEVEVAYGHSLLVGANEEVLEYLWAPAFSKPPLNLLTPFYQPSVFIRRRVLGSQLVDEGLHYVMDLDLWRRLAPTARFGRVNSLIAIDRHQATRKVLQPEYFEEQRMYNTRISFDSSRPAFRIARFSLKICIRVIGIPKMVLIDRRLQPAIPLRVGSRTQSLKLQTVVRRSRLSHPDLAFERLIEPFAGVMGDG